MTNNIIYLDQYKKLGNSKKEKDSTVTYNEDPIFSISTLIGVVKTSLDLPAEELEAFPIKELVNFLKKGEKSIITVCFNDNGIMHVKVKTTKISLLKRLLNKITERKNNVSKP